MAKPECELYRIKMLGQKKVFSMKKFQPKALFQAIGLTIALGACIGGIIFLATHFEIPDWLFYAFWGVAVFLVVVKVFYWALTDGKQWSSKR